MHPAFWAAFKDELDQAGFTKTASPMQVGRTMAGGLQGMIAKRGMSAAPSATRATGLLAKANGAAAGALKVAV